MPGKKPHIVFIEWAQHVNFQRALELLGRFDRFRNLASRFSVRFLERQISLDHFAVRLRAPSVGTAGNADVGTQLRILDPHRKAPDRLFESPWIVEPGFIDGIEIKPGLTLGAKPMFEGSCTSNLKGLFEIPVDILDADEKCGVALVRETFRAGEHFECLASPRLRQNDGTIFLVYFRPTLVLLISKICEDFPLVRVVLRSGDWRKAARTSGTGSLIIILILCLPSALLALEVRRRLPISEPKYGMETR